MAQPNDRAIAVGSERYLDRARTWWQISVALEAPGKDHTVRWLDRDVLTADAIATGHEQAIEAGRARIEVSSRALPAAIEIRVDEIAKHDAWRRADARLDFDGLTDHFARSR